MFVKDCMKGRQGKHTYFSAAFTWGELGQMAVFPEALGDLDDEEQMQRALAKKRITEMVSYLTSEDDHFFSALTLIILPRNLDRAATEMTHEMGEDEDDWDYAFEKTGSGPVSKNLGRLTLSGNVQLFPADGQHRLRAGLAALREKPDALRKEEVPVVLIPYESHDQVRQLFSDLNLNAKPVSKTIGYSFDTRDETVLIAKHVARTVDLFIGRVNRVSNSLSKSSLNVITMNTLVEGTRDILGGLATLERTSREKYIETQGLDNAAREVALVWETLVNVFEDYWEPVLRQEPLAAGGLREEYIFPHGLGWRALTAATGQLLTHYPADWAELLQQTADVIDWRRGNEEWQNKAMTGERVNNTGPGIAATKTYILDVANQIAEDRGVKKAA